MEKSRSAAGVKKKGELESDFERAGKGRELDNRAVERGTQEALKIIAGNKEDKVTKAVKEGTVEAKKQTDLLKILAKKPGLAPARL